MSLNEQVWQIWVTLTKLRHTARSLDLQPYVLRPPTSYVGMSQFSPPGHINPLEMFYTFQNLKQLKRIYQKKQMTFILNQWNLCVLDHLTCIAIVFLRMSSHVIPLTPPIPAAPPMACASRLFSAADWLKPPPELLEPPALYCQELRPVIPPAPVDT